MCEGNPPYMEESSAMRALFLIVSKGRPPFKDPDSMSDELKNFIEICTVMDPSQRPSSKVSVLLLLLLMYHVFY